MIASADIERLLEKLDGSAPAVLAVRIPKPERELGVADACALLSSNLQQKLDALRNDLQRLHSLQNSPPAPILGVIGDLNGGKSSLVASFLSETGCKRIPRGLRDQDGTHRFVLWCPTAWKQDPLIWQSIAQRLESVFGSSLEYLSDDPLAAHAQYNGQGTPQALSIPLVAFDSQLDQLQVCLLDSPDVETATDHISIETRKQIVTNASRLTSALLFVVAREHFRADKLSRLAAELRSQTGTRDFFLFINKLRPGEDQPQQLLHEPSVQQFLGNLGLTEKHLFVAYDFAHRQADDYLPTQAAQSLRLPENLPWFFQISIDAANQSNAVAVSRLANAYLQALDKVDLCEKEKVETLHSIRETLTSLHQEFRTTLEEHQSELREIRTQCFRFLRRQLSTDNRLNTPFTPSLLAKLAESIQRTVPFYLKPSIWTNQQWSQATKVLGNLKQTIFSKVSGIPADSLQQVKELGATLQTAGNTQSPLTASQIAKEFQQLGIASDSISPTKLEEAWQQILNSLEQVSTNLDETKLDAVSRKIWKDIPLRKKIFYITIPPIAVFSGLVSLLIGFADGGTGILLSASLGELLASAGLLAAGGTTATMAGAKYQQWLVEGFTLDAYQQMLAACCDVFGLPRSEAPVADEFTNTGKVYLRLSDAPPLDEVIRLTAAIDGREIPQGWKTLHHDLSS